MRGLINKGRKEMKRFIVLFAIALFLMGCIAVNIGRAEDQKEKPPPYKPFECPRTHISNQDKCFACHVPPSFEIKEINIHALYDYPYNTKIYTDKNGERYGFYSLKGDIDHNSTGFLLETFFFYIESHGIKKAVIDTQSFGGSVFEGWRCKSVIDDFQERGIKVTTKVHAVAASAATLVFLAADNRVISPTAELMFHELWTFDFLKISSPSDKEDEARILRHIQDGITTFVASRGTLSKKEIDEKIRKKEFWVNGSEAMEYGFATGMIGK